MIKNIYAKSCGGHSRYSKVLCILFYFYIPSALLQLIDSLANCSGCMSPGLGIRKPKLCSKLVGVFELKPRPLYIQFRGHLFPSPTHLFNKYLPSFSMVQINSILPMHSTFGNTDSWKPCNHLGGTLLSAL